MHEKNASRGASLSPPAVCVFAVWKKSVRRKGKGIIHFPHGKRLQLVTGVRVKISLIFGRNYTGHKVKNKKGQIKPSAWVDEKGGSVTEKSQ